MCQDGVRKTICTSNPNNYPGWVTMKKKIPVAGTCVKYDPSLSYSGCSPLLLDNF